MAEPAGHRVPRTSPERPFLRTVRLRNYKSIESCAVELAPVTLVVGPNAAGKSNFLDGLHFLADCLNDSLRRALSDRGGFDIVRRLGSGELEGLAIQLEVNLPEGSQASYGFEIGAAHEQEIAVRWESCHVSGEGGEIGHFSRAGRELLGASESSMPPVFPDRLYLESVAGMSKFEPLLRALRTMRFYRLDPRAMRHPQKAEHWEPLRENGENTAAVLARLSSQQPELEKRLQEYLGAIVPDFVKFEVVSAGPWKTLAFWLEVQGQEDVVRFDASSMSDGTLHALGVLLAITQVEKDGQPLRLVGLEEPETALHPAAAAVLMDAIREAAEHTQVVLTSHSPDVLDQIDLQNDALLVAASSGSRSRITPASRATIEAIRRRLYSAGELLQMEQVQPERGALAESWSGSDPPRVPRQS